MYTIVYFLDYGKSYGGAVQTLLEQARLVQQVGNSVHILISNYDGNKLDDGYQDVLKSKGLDYQFACFQMSSQPEDIDLICLSVCYENVKATVQAYAPDIIHSVQLNPMAELISRELDIPHIMNIYPLLDDFFKQKYTDIFPHYHICDSEYWAKRWQRYLHTNYTCIRTCVDAAPQRKIGFSTDLNCLCVGTIYEGKNQLEVIKGFHKALLNRFPGKLFLYGYAEGKYSDQCRQYIYDNQIDSRVFIMGFQSDLRKAYQKGDVLICGSRRESYPNVISEAMAYGLLVLSTPVGGIPEVIRDGENGYLTNGESAECIADGLDRVLKDIQNGNADNVRNREYDTVEQLHASNMIRENLLNYYKFVLHDYDSYKSNNRPSICDVLHQYEGIINCFNNNKSLFSNQYAVSLKLWYIAGVKKRIEKAILEKKGFYIWGTGKMCKSVLEIISVFFEKINIQGMIDSNARGLYREYKIYKPDEIINKDNVIIFIALCNGQQEVISIFEKNRKSYLKDYFILTSRVW